jgi:uncharacterized membrane protein YdfJ with MMPL/SSD domain
VAIIVLLVVFGSLIAGVTPIIMGIFAIGVAMGLVGVFGQVWRFSFFVPNLISMMGLAVGIDYSLFIVSRYREERQHGRDNLGGGRDGRARRRTAPCFFSGMTVVLALAGMLLVPTTIFRGLAGGAILVVLISVALSMTLLPALMALFADHLVKPGWLFGRGPHPRARPGRWLLGSDHAHGHGSAVGVADRDRVVHALALRSVLGAVEPPRRRPWDPDRLLGYHDDPRRTSRRGRHSTS